jgi:hypothetical protein
VGGSGAATQFSVSDRYPGDHLTVLHEGRHDRLGVVGMISGACFADFGHAVVCTNQEASKRGTAVRKQADMGLLSSLPAFETNHLIWNEFVRGRRGR